MDGFDPAGGEPWPSCFVGAGTNDRDDSRNIVADVSRVGLPVKQCFAGPIPVGYLDANGTEQSWQSLQVDSISDRT